MTTHPPNILFILVDDLGVGESHDLADTQPDALKTLEALMQEHIRRAGAIPWQKDCK